MKKLLFLSNIIWLFLFFYSCHNNHAISTADSGKKHLTTTVQQGRDSVSGKGKINPVGVSGADGGATKDTLSKTGNSTAITHGSPNQVKLDSIKEAKAKDKKK
jgi:hypothetical protein